MKIFVNREIKGLFILVFVCMGTGLIASQIILWLQYGAFSLPLLAAGILTGGMVLLGLLGYFQRQNQMMESATARIEAYLSGDTDARIDCDREGELYRLFHSVNTLAAVLNAHAKKELRAREFLKNTISDISHQLKTPLAALSIYNGLLQNEAAELAESDRKKEREKNAASVAEIQEFTALSEKELDRIEALVQNLLQITRLDAGMIVMEKTLVSIADMMHDIALHFAYRAGQEQKELRLSGAEDVVFWCDRDWFMEAVSNLVKNALDHTGRGDVAEIAWRESASMVQITVKDNGEGIHPEDLHHIFKRFYRSRFSAKGQGIGLGLPLAKAIIEAHGGSIEVESEVGKGTVFVINYFKNAVLQ